MKDLVFYFDMDGVLADFKRGVKEICGITPPMQDASMTKEDDDAMWEKIREADHFYAKLPLMPRAKELFSYVYSNYGSNCRILTAVPKPKRNIPEAGEDKIQWAHEQLSEDIEINIVLKEEKKNYCEGKHCILIDDYKENIEAWEAMGGTGILFVDAEETLNMVKKVEAHMINKMMDELKESPLFALSLCGKELAHSNFWKWLIYKTDDNGKQPFVEVFIPDFEKKGYKFESAEREENHMDIVIHYEESGEKKVHIIENKLKSIPTKKQLEEYQDKIKETKKVPIKFAGGTLTGIESPVDIDFDEDLKEWSFLSYKAIAEKIKEINGNRFNDAIIDSYADDLEAIYSIISSESNNNSELYKHTVSKELDEIRLSDIVLKYRGEKLKKEWSERIQKSSELESKWGFPRIDTSFNNKKPTITIVYYQTEKEEEIDVEVGRLGVQLEGDQFRIYGGPGIDATDSEKVFEKFCDLGWHEKYDREKHTIDGRETSMRGGGKKPHYSDYCQYKGEIKYKGLNDSKKYIHIYQYWNIKEDGWTKESLYKEVEKKLKEAKDIIDSGLDFKKI